MGSQRFAEDRRLSDLIGRLYDAAIDARLWIGLAASLASVLDSNSTVVKLHGADSSVELLENTENLVVPERERDWAEHWHRNDLWVERTVAHGPSRIVTGEDLITPDEMRNSAFYQEWLHHLDIHHVIGGVFPTGDDRIAVLGIHRPVDGEIYSQADRDKVAVLLPHLQRALHLSRRLATASLAQTAALDALDYVDAGILVVDAARRIIHANALAESVLRANAEITVLNGRLTIAQPTLHARLAALIHQTLEAGGPPMPVLAIPRPDRLPLMLTATLLRPIWSRRDGQRPLTLIFIRDPEQTAADTDQLRHLFGLTRSEAAIAAELGRGRSLERIAEAHGIGISTVRSHLKRILAKSGTSRQAEFVALIARSIAPIRIP
jgi:DNA-binding CsgD family transcriptional regulator/PAS domain-containing protein